MSTGRFRRPCGPSPHGLRPAPQAAPLEQVFRDEWGRVLAALIGFLGDFDLAEEAAQEAFAVAAERWPRDGTPANPVAWLVTTARNRAIDRIRRDRTLAAKTRLLDVPEATEDERRQVYADYQAVNATPGATPGSWMEPPETATTVRIEDGQTLTTDGPFVAVKEALGGYLFYEADDLDAAIELASRIPAARMGGGIEIRPLKEA